MLLITILTAHAWADTPTEPPVPAEVRASVPVPAEAPSVDEAVALLEGCSEPGVCEFACWDNASRIVEPAANGSLRLICYQDDQAHGPMVVWRDSGRPEGVGFSNRGVPHGGFEAGIPTDNEPPRGDGTTARQSANSRRGTPPDGAPLPVSGWMVSKKVW